MQLSKLQNLDRLSLLEAISLDDINNKSHHKLQVKDKQLKKIRDITSLLFAEIAIQRWQHIQWELLSSSDHVFLWTCNKRLNTVNIYSYEQ